MLLNVAKLATLIALAILIPITLVILGEFLLALLLHFTALSLWLWGTLSPNSRLFGSITSSQATGELLITIDDGPDPDSTPLLLSLLEEHNIKAVFFLIGKRAILYPELVLEIHQAGHLIGNHTYSHPEKTFWMYGPWRTQREVLACQNALTEITGEPPTYFRAPVGHSNLFVHSALKACELQLMGWNCRGYDASPRDISAIKEKLLPDIKPNAIILMHEQTKNEEEILLSIIETARQRNLTFLPLDNQRSDHTARA